MNSTESYLEVNRANWDARAPLHVESADYALERFRADKDFISGVVQFDLPLLGDIAGQRGVHLQCHIGTDTVSLGRLGARMVGLDFSSASLDFARKLALDSDSDAVFVESDIYRALSVLEESSFDFVYTGIGSLCWLPSIDLWASVVSNLLTSGGRLFIREGHPVLWSIDDERSDALVLKYPYFEHVDPVVWNDDGTYVETDRVVHASVTHEWNHGLGEIIEALLRCGMRIDSLIEHASVPWEALPGQMTRGEGGEWKLSNDPERLPLSYTLRATKQ